MARPAEAPIYDALAWGWALCGRCVPGQHDLEWAELAGRPAWPEADPRAVPAAAGTAPGNAVAQLSPWLTPAPPGPLPPYGAGDPSPYAPHDH